MPFAVSVRAEVKSLSASLDAFARKQLPFATAQALTATARIVQQVEREAMKQTFDRPTPFTLNSVKVKPARKNNLQAVVFVQDIAAAFLKPYEDGGVHSLGRKRALLVPKNVPVNQYGNLARNKLASLKAQPNVFIGSVRSKTGGLVSGVWQRIQQRGGKPHLKLLIRFEAPLPVRQHLDFRKRAELTARAAFAPEMTKALGKALSTAR